MKGALEQLGIGCSLRPVWPTSSWSHCISDISASSPSSPYITIRWNLNHLHALMIVINLSAMIQSQSVSNISHKPTLTMSNQCLRQHFTQLGPSDPPGFWRRKVNHRARLSKVTTVMINENRQTFPMEPTNHRKPKVVYSRQIRRPLIHRQSASRPVHRMMSAFGSSVTSAKLPRPPRPELWALIPNHPRTIPTWVCTLRSHRWVQLRPSHATLGYHLRQILLMSMLHVPSPFRLSNRNHHIFKWTSI